MNSTPTPVSAPVRVIAAFCLMVSCDRSAPEPDFKVTLSPVAPIGPADSAMMSCADVSSATIVVRSRTENVGDQVAAVEFHEVLRQDPADHFRGFPALQARVDLALENTRAAFLPTDQVELVEDRDPESDSVFLSVVARTTLDVDDALERLQRMRDWWVEQGPEEEGPPVAITVEYV